MNAEATTRRILACRGASATIISLSAAAAVAAGLWSSRIPWPDRNVVESRRTRRVSW
ncbi:hypothetical protein ACFQ9X_08680 [Catenulispora yoronensis]